MNHDNLLYDDYRHHHGRRSGIVERFDLLYLPFTWALLSTGSGPSLSYGLSQLFFLHEKGEKTGI